MLQPKRVKYRKVQKGRIKGIAQRGHRIAFGDFALKILESGRVTARQIEAVRVVITRTMQRKGQVWLRAFPDIPITKKPAEVRMGKGKGNPEYWIARIKPGRILFEIAGVSLDIAKEAMRVADHRLGLKTKMVVRQGYHEKAG